MNSLIDQTIAFVKTELANAEGGHDWFHIERVYKNTLHIAKKEKVDIMVVSLAALLHDIADPKFHDGDETVGPKIAREFLFNQNVDSKIIEHVVAIIENMSFKNTFETGEKFTSSELEVVIKTEFYIIQKLNPTLICLKKTIKILMHQQLIIFMKNCYYSKIK